MGAWYSVNYAVLGGITSLILTLILVILIILILAVFFQSRTGMAIRATGDNEEDITFLKQHKRAYNIGCLYQNPLRGTAPNRTIEENLALAYTRKSSKGFFSVNKKDTEYFRERLSELNMGLEDRMKTNMGQLSGGQREDCPGYCRRRTYPDDPIQADRLFP